MGSRTHGTASAPGLRLTQPSTSASSCARVGAAPNRHAASAMHTVQCMRVASMKPTSAARVWPGVRLAALWLPAVRSGSHTARLAWGGLAAACPRSQVCPPHLPFRVQREPNGTRGERGQGGRWCARCSSPGYRTSTPHPKTLLASATCMGWLSHHPVQLMMGFNIRDNESAGQQPASPALPWTGLSDRGWRRRSSESRSAVRVPAGKCPRCRLAPAPPSYGHPALLPRRQAQAQCSCCFGCRRRTV